jgi:hypothetical protein
MTSSGRSPHFGMLDPDHRGFRHAGAAHGDVLDLDRGDPFAARLDHVLRPVGHLHVAVLVERRDVAGVEPVLGIEARSALALVVGFRHRRPAHLEPAEGLAVPGRSRPSSSVIFISTE